MKKRILIFIFGITHLFVFADKQADIDSLKQLLAIDSDSAKIITNLKIANCFSYINFDSASNYIGKAQTLLHPDHAYQLWLNYYYENGFVNKRQGNFDLALQDYHRALKISETNNDSLWRYHLLSSIGGLMSHNGNDSLGIVYLLQALELAELLKDTFSLANNLCDLASMYIYANPNKAIELTNKAVHYYNHLKDVEGLSFAYNNLGISYSNLNDFVQSEQYFLKALHQKELLGNLHGQAVTLNNLSYFCYSLSQSEKNAFEKEKLLKRSVQYANKSLIVSAKVNSIYTRRNTYGTLINVYQDLGDYVKTLEVQTLFMQVKDSIFNIEKQKNIEELEAKYQNQKKQIEIERLEQKTHIQQLEIRQQQITTVLIVGILIILLLIGVLYFQRYKLKQQNIKSRLNSQKLEIEQRMIRSQMNPHFIFNSLNSIQSFIVNGKTEAAKGYLYKFANLLRLVLENSRHEFVALSDEIKSLQNYIEIEQLRFDHHFNFEITDETDEAEFIGVPPMLIQPFVENAIIHGLQNANGNRLLKLNYSINDDDYLVCTVEDNGIGRAESNRRKANQSSKKHDSLALKLISERIAILKTEWNKNISLQIIDIQEKEKTGTKVILVLPIKNV